MTGTHHETTTTSGMVVRPLRFTDHVQEMRDFLVLLGLSPRVSSESGSWIDLVGAAGLTALHAVATSSTGAVPGQTDLGFEVDDLDRLGRALGGAGVDDVEVVDEAWGRVLRLTTPAGVSAWVDEVARDDYGYRRETPQPRHGVTTAPVRITEPAGPYPAMLAALGFRRLDEGDDQWWRVWSAGGNGGLIALHPPTDEAIPGDTRLGFRTDEPLTALADRLDAAGHSDVSVTDEFGGELTVTDPDGQHVLVQRIGAVG